MKIQKIIDMLNKAEANNQPYDITTVSSQEVTTENEPSTTTNLSQAPPSSCTSRWRDCELIFMMNAEAK